MYNVLDTINSPQHADNIKGLKVLVGEVMSDACDWVSHIMIVMMACNYYNKLDQSHI
jgi:hypothetical protein